MPLSLTKIEMLINSAIQYYFWAATILLVGFMAYAGFLMASAGSDPKRFERGKKMLGQVIVGGLVVFGIGVIVNTIAHFAQYPAGVY